MQRGSIFVKAGLHRASLAVRSFATRAGSVQTRFREPVEGKKRMVMAYSGGLDTSCQLLWLTKVDLDYLFNTSESLCEGES